MIFRFRKEIVPLVSNTRPIRNNFFTIFCFNHAIPIPPILMMQAPCPVLTRWKVSFRLQKKKGMITTSNQNISFLVDDDSPWLSKWNKSWWRLDWKRFFRTNGKKKKTYQIEFFSANCFYFAIIFQLDDSQRVVSGVTNPQILIGIYGNSIRKIKPSIRTIAILMRSSAPCDDVHFPGLRNH